MRVFVFEEQLNRRAGLEAELHSVDLQPHFIAPEFFTTDILALAKIEQEKCAVLLAESEEVRRQIQTLRQNKCASPVIVIRDFRNARDTAELLDLGADDVMVSPIRGAEVLSRINSVIRRLHGHASDSVVVGELTAYFDGRDPVISGNRIKLSKREHSVFQHLALNSNKVISKDAIYDAVYGSAIEQPFDKVIDVYICKLRKKISAASSSGWQYIETVQGRGYKLTQPEKVSEAS